MLKEKKLRRGGERKARRHLTGFSSVHCQLPDDDFPDVRELERKKREGMWRKSQTEFLFFNSVFISFPPSFQGWSVAAHTAIRLLSALIASISLTALAETKDLGRKNCQALWLAINSLN